MGTENPNRAPFFPSSNPLAGGETSFYRPSNPIASSNVPSSFSSGPLAGPGRPNNPAGPPPPSSFGPRATNNGTFQQFPGSQFSYAARVPPVRPAGPFPTPPVSFGTQMQPQPPSILPMGFPPQSINAAQPGGNVAQSTPGINLQPSSPPMRAAYSAAGGSIQSAFQGYPVRQPNVVPQAQPANPVPQQYGYAVQRPGASSPYLSQQGGYIQHPNSMPHAGAVEGLVEDFCSLALASVPGSFDAGIDSKALPRPLDGDIEPKSFAEMYPMNCSSRYLRLSTCGMPNSQSLASRWHLPLGAVVCPLAEAPEGEEVPIVDFVTTGIIRCRRCRTYVNPYVTFIDHGRKWKCNICLLLNDGMIFQLHKDIGFVCYLIWLIFLYLGIIEQ